MKKSIREKNNKGAAMLLTVTIIAIIMVFCFSLILISYNLYSSQNKNVASMRNEEASNSLSIALKDELTGNDVSNSALWKYLRMNIAYQDTSIELDYNDWPYYDPNDSNHSMEKARKEFLLSGNPDMVGVPAKVTVYMYWTLPPNYKENIANGNPSNLNGTKLYINVVSETGNQVYETEKIYKLSVKKNDVEGKAILDSIQNDKNFNPAHHSINKDEKWIWKSIKN